MHEPGVHQAQKIRVIVVKEEVILMESRIRYPGRPLGLDKGQDLRSMRPWNRDVSSEVDFRCRNITTGIEEEGF